MDDTDIFVIYMMLPFALPEAPKTPAEAVGARQNTFRPWYPRRGWSRHSTPCQPTPSVTPTEEEPRYWVRPVWNAYVPPCAQSLLIAVDLTFRPKYLDCCPSVG